MGRSICRRSASLTRVPLICLIGSIAFVGVGCCVGPLPMLPPPSADVSALNIETLPATADAYHHVPTIVTLPSGELLAAWVAGERELADDTRIVFSRRSAGPAGTWSAAATLADTPDRPDANPVLFRDDAGRLHLYYASMFGATFCESLILTRVSDDDGATWSPDRIAVPAVCTLLKNKPIILANGVWLMPAYVEATYASQFFASLDRGATWFALGPPLLSLPWNNLQPAVVQLADGSLLAHMRTVSGAGFTWEARSCDGIVWRPLPRVDLPNPGSGLDLIRLSTGHLVVAYNDSPTARTPLVVALSADEGRTWLPPKTLASGPGRFAYPSLVESADGMIHCVFSADTATIRHAQFNRAWLEAP